MGNRNFVEMNSPRGEMGCIGVENYSQLENVGGGYPDGGIVFTNGHSIYESPSIVDRKSSGRLPRGGKVGSRSNILKGVVSNARGYSRENHGHRVITDRDEIASLSSDLGIRTPYRMEVYTVHPIASKDEFRLDTSSYSFALFNHHGNPLKVVPVPKEGKLSQSVEETVSDLMTFSVDYPNGKYPVVSSMVEVGEGGHLGKAVFDLGAKASEMFGIFHGGNFYGIDNNQIIYRGDDRFFHSETVNGRRRLVPFSDLPQLLGIAEGDPQVIIEEKPYVDRRIFRDNRNEMADSMGIFAETIKDENGISQIRPTRTQSYRRFVVGRQLERSRRLRKQDRESQRAELAMRVAAESSLNGHLDTTDFRIKVVDSVSMGDLRLAGLSRDNGSRALTYTPAQLEWMRTHRPSLDHKIFESSGSDGNYVRPMNHKYVNAQIAVDLSRVLLTTDKGITEGFASEGSVESKERLLSRAFKMAGRDDLLIATRRIARGGSDPVETSIKLKALVEEYMRDTPNYSPRMGGSLTCETTEEFASLDKDIDRELGYSAGGEPIFRNAFVYGSSARALRGDIGREPGDVDMLVVVNDYETAMDRLRGKRFEFKGKPVDVSVFSEDVFSGVLATIPDAFARRVEGFSTRDPIEFPKMKDETIRIRSLAHAASRHNSLIGASASLREFMPVLRNSNGLVRALSIVPALNTEMMMIAGSGEYVDRLESERLYAELLDDWGLPNPKEMPADSDSEIVDLIVTSAYASGRVLDKIIEDRVFPAIEKSDHTGRKKRRKEEKRKAAEESRIHSPSPFRY